MDFGEPYRGTRVLLRIIIVMIATIAIVVMIIALFLMIIIIFWAHGDGAVMDRGTRDAALLEDMRGS